MTLPIERAETRRPSRAAVAASADSAEIAISRPPEVCGSNSRSRYSGPTLSAKATDSPNSLRIDEARHRVAKLNIVIANRVAANDGAICFHHLRKPAANDGFQNLRIPLVGETHNRERGNRLAAHGVNIAQGIGCRNLSKGRRVINDGGKEIDRL